jgi:Flp pilus assembly protein TadD
MVRAVVSPIHANSERRPRSLRLAHWTASHRLELLIGLLLALGTWAVFSPARAGEFVNFDDNLYVTDNLHLRAGLSVPALSWAFTTFHAGNWHPLTWISLLTDYQRAGLEPSAYHRTNVLLHAAAAVLLFAALTAISGAVWPSALVAGLFAWHPLHVESVAWVSERKDVLSGLFWMLTLLAYAAYVHRPARWRYLLVIVAYALGLLAKPMLVTLPCVLLLLDFWPLGRAASSADWMRLTREKVPLFLLALGSAVLTAVAQHRGGAVHELTACPLGMRLENAVVAYVAYVGSTFWPMGLAVFYPHPGPTLSAARILGSAALLAAVSAAVLVVARRLPYLFVGWFWYLGTLVPVIGLVQVGNQAMADRYTYIPLVGIFMMAAWAARDLALRFRCQAIIAGAAAAALTGCLVVTWQQATVWHDSVTLWSHTLAVTRDNVLAHYNYGMALDAQGRLEDAANEYEAALKIMPTAPEAHFQLGRVLDRQGKSDLAVEHFTAVTRLRPDEGSAYLQLGQVLLKRGDFPAARSALLAAEERLPENADVHGSLGIVLKRQGDIDGAEHEYRLALACDPSHARSHYNLGLLLLDRHDFAGAEAEFAAALRSDPAHARARHQLDLLTKGGHTKATAVEDQQARHLDSRP